MSVFKVASEVVLKSAALTVWDALIFPVTSSASVGDSLPIPSLPLDRLKTANAVDPFLIAKSVAVFESVNPIRFAVPSYDIETSSLSPNLSTSPSPRSSASLTFKTLVAVKRLSTVSSLKCPCDQLLPTVPINPAPPVAG